MALLDRRLDSPAAFAIWLVSHAGRSLLPPPDRQPIGSAGADRLFLYVIGCRRSGSAQQRAGGRCRLSRPGLSGASEQTKARPGSRNRDGPLTCRYIRGQVDRSKTNGEDARLHLDRSMLEASRHVTSLGPGVPMTDPRGQWSHHRRHAYRDALQCPGGQGPAQGHQIPRRHRRGGEVPRLQAVRCYVSLPSRMRIRTSALPDVPAPCVRSSDTTACRHEGGAPGVGSIPSPQRHSSQSPLP